jgi:hypothetical protein
MSQRNASTLLASTPVNAAVRELPSTRRHTTGSHRCHGLAIALLLAGLAACGGGKRTDSYKQASSKQQSCCESLTGADRDQCLGDLVQVEDPAVASSEANQATYRCVEAHFVCDPSTGHASPESAQQQYDCIADLGE